MTSYYSNIFLVETGSIFLLNQIENYQQADLIIYQQLIGKLMYLSCGTRSNIAFIVE